MPSDFLRSGVPDAHTATRQRLTSLLDLPKLYRTIDADPAIVGAGVVHIGSDYRVAVLREFVPLCSIKPKRVILREVAGPLVTAAEYAQLAASSPSESQLWKEAAGMALSCGGAVIGFEAARLVETSTMYSSRCMKSSTIMTYSIDPFREYRIWRRYAYRFLPSFDGGLLLGLNNITTNMALSLPYYAEIFQMPTELAFGIGMALCVIFNVGQIMLCEGFRYAPRILVPITIVNILLAIGYLSSHPLTLISVFLLFTALLYILVLNSKNHRRYTSMLRVKRRRKIRANAAFP
jgi:hypothetical protein